MLIDKIKKIAWWRLQLRFEKLFPSKLETFLREVPGVIHIGANNGGERWVYGKHDLQVVWVEPNPIVFRQLEKNIENFKKQHAFQYLVTDKDSQEYNFHIANNNGASSSIFDMKLHLELCPDVVYESTIKLQSVTLQTLLEKEFIDVERYPSLVIDVQGAELLVLQGATDLLSEFKFIKLEVADFESYEGCCKLTDVVNFLNGKGFREVIRRKFAEHPSGFYYDVLYERE